MFKAYSVSLLNALLFISLSLHAADYSGGSSELAPELEYPASVNPHDAFGLHEKAASKNKQSLKPGFRFSDQTFLDLLNSYKTELPSQEAAENIVNRLMRDHPDLSFTIPSIRYPAFCEDEYPSRLLFVGPSGYGKTTAAKAIAKYCNATCIFIKGSAIGDTYQNSGSVLIDKVFGAILERPERLFVVIIDELIAVSQLSGDNKDIQQNKIVMSLWQALDQCELARHVCLIGTDNQDPEKLPIQLRTRFAYNTFTFKNAISEDILGFMKERLRNRLDEKCSDEFLAYLAESVKLLSLREIKILIGKSKLLAAHELKNPKAKVTERHLKQIFSANIPPTGLSKAWKDRNKYWGNLTSPRSIAVGALVAGTGIKLYDSYRRNGFTLSTGAALLLGTAYAIKYCCPKQDKEEDTNDLQFFSAVNHLTDQHESHAQWETSHAFNVQNSEEAKDARKDDIERADVHLKLAQNADERAEEQMEQTREAHERAKSEQITRLKEALKQIAMDRSKEGYVPSDALNKHEAYLKEELYRLKPDERPQEPVKEKGLLSFFWG